MSILIKLGHVDGIEYMDENMTMKINLIILHKFITWMSVMNLMEAMKLTLLMELEKSLNMVTLMKMQHLVDNMKDSNEMDEIDNTIGH